MGNLNADDEHVTASHSALFTPSCERLLSQFLAVSDVHSQPSSFDVHDLSSLGVSFDHQEYSSMHESQRALRLTAARQVEHCHNVLSRLDATPSLPLHIGPSPFHDVVHSICTEPLPTNCIASIRSQGTRVIELFGGMVSGLDCLLRNGIHIIQYSYCDISNQARLVAHHRLTQLTAQYPDQLTFEAWSSAFTTLPQDVYSILGEHLISAGALEDSPLLLIAGFECAHLSPP
jgi:hypothetical protein